MKVEKIRKRRVQRSIFLSILITLLVGTGYYFYSKTVSVKKIEASTVITEGEFDLTAENRWDETEKKNYAELNWDSLSNLSQNGYQLYQSENQTDWNQRSLKYNQQITVLNVYPDKPESDTLEGWMAGLDWKDDNQLIEVDSCTITDFNAGANNILKDGDNYKYDVIMFGSWDFYNQKMLAKDGYDATKAFIDSGRGVLFGHDTMLQHVTVKPPPGGKDYFFEFYDSLGIGFPDDLSVSNNYIPNTSSWTGGEKVRILNDGYLMKYPFAMQNEEELTIPETHNTTLSDQSVGTVWAEFIEPFSSTNRQDIYDDGIWRGGWYLKTNNNVAAIQTGHSNGQSTVGENKIIANVLYNLAQVSLENNANERTVEDDQAPNSPSLDIRCGDRENLNIRVNAQDVGKKYRWYVEADIKDHGVKKSDTVEEEIISNIAGYFYQVVDTPDDVSYKASIIAKKDSTHNRIDESEFDPNLYVAPNNDSLSYNTTASFTINEKQDSEKYLQVIAVDRSGNVSEVTTVQIKDVTQQVDFEVERTADEAKLVEVELDSSVEDKMKSIEIQIPKNTEIKDFASLTLPMDWYSFENSETVDYYSFSFAMEDNNSAATIKDFLEELRFTITDPVDASGSIKVILHEKVYTSWVDEDGTTHYYVFIEDTTEPGTNWFQAYNKAKQLRYRGLTGYLATITSAEEHDFIFDNIARAPGLLGGARAVLADGSKIDDDSIIPQTRDEYDIDQDDWYWVSGPESGEVFFVGKDAIVGNTPANAYSSFAPGEPNNAIEVGGEYILQFAKDDSKEWNDLHGDLGYDQRYNHGYYVEFSEYGGQTEGEEITDVCWKAAIPQKINIQAYTERLGQTQRLARGDIIYDQELRIGKQITAQPNDFELFTFLEHRERMGDSVQGARPLGNQYTITKDFQEGAFIYANRQVMLHVRQVVLEPENQLVNPEKGYLNLKTSLYDVDSGNHVEDSSQLIQTQIPSQHTDAVSDFETFVVSTKHMTDELDQLSLNLILPEFYEYVGNFITPRHFEDPNDPMGADHQGKTENDLYGGIIERSRRDIDMDREYFITLYIKPTTAGKTPQPYSWDYKKNDLGEIKTQ
ncbi:hypothetical protein [Enterococcus pallens]|uniref:DUF5057 domain-containing protein n=1 Tax=Enterococcus pallens ATCC BAA-351 TaxID=1158607 RepID=R2TBX2_9ENTE|nr:hypothetical protein [Enterococcus pallens]EOH97739.1 hypothetical protein UAU_00407 [Enterococcus pallens ATCC BAA-351]EOU20842.1 hypothetical protein I588_01689 [Enterococcus pallens ATCC BAA-351]